MAIRSVLISFGIMAALCVPHAGASDDVRVAKTDSASMDDLNPTGKLHIPIGIPDSVDTLKTFVEAEGNFSPGFATFGVYCWVRDPATGKLYAPTQSDSACSHGLAEGALLIPWSSWKAGDFTVRTEVCQVRREAPTGAIQVVAQRIELANPTAQPRKASLFVAIRPLGPAGWPIKSMAVKGNDALLVEGHTAAVPDRKPQAIGVADTDSVGASAIAGQVPDKTSASSNEGNCSGSMQFDIDLPANGHTTLAVFCPVLAGRRAVGHQWEPGGNDNFREAAVYNPSQSGQLQPDPGAAWCRSLSAREVFDGATNYWRHLTGRARLSLPDRRWSEAFTAIAGHIAMNLNEGAPDVAVINYTTFNRDGMYNTEVLQQSGMNDFAVRAIDYLYAHPFNGRPYPEADNPGQILWVTAQHWLYTRDKAWLDRILPKARKMAQLIRYCRTTPRPHWVDMNSLEFGDAVPKDRRQELQPGRCDGFNFNYTDAFDVAGLRAVALLCDAAGESQEAGVWSALAKQLMANYDEKFGDKLPKGYGSYSVLWPCRLYPLDSGPAHDQFRKVGPQKYAEWPYFGPATAHQGLLAGNREAGYGTLAIQLDHPQMRDWYAFDEGGPSGEGGWNAPLRTRWKKTRAMPHGWAVAEITLLLRDCLALEDGGRLILLAGVPEAWLRGQSADQKDIAIENLPTHFGGCSFTYAPTATGATLHLTGVARPPAGFVLRLPASLARTITADGKPVAKSDQGDWVLPTNAREIDIVFAATVP